MDSMLFLRAFWENRRQVGTPFQSSRLAARKICDSIDFRTASRIIEIGAGPGSITREILRLLKPDAEMVAFEVNRDFCRRLRNIQDRRLVVHNASGFEIPRFFSGKADYVVSEIPIASLSPAALNAFYQVIKTVLCDTGSCLQLQLSLLSYRHIRPLFRNVKVRLALLNLPPLFIYCCSDYADGSPRSDDHGGSASFTKLR
jgi:phospholipid N-methyltransferase